VTTAPAPAARRWSLLLVLGGAVAFALLTWWRVPWDPVPGGPLRPAPASSVFTDQQVALLDHVARWSRFWSWGSLATSLVAYLVLARSARLRARLARTGAGWRRRVLEGTVVVTVAVELATLPWGVGLQVLRLRHGLTTQSWWGFAQDRLTGLAIGLVVTSAGLLLLVALLRRAPRTWPAWGALVAGAFVVLGSFAYPVTVEPLFNSFTPLPDGPLRSGVLRLADREHVAVAQVLVADASRRTTSLNAYVSGFGGTRRVVLYDNVVNDMPRPQVLAIVAHELSHARHDDVLTGTLLGTAGAAVGVGLLGVVLTRRRRAGDDVPGEGPGEAGPALVPVVLALVAVGTLLGTPVTSAVSRRLESRADVDALVATRDAETFAGMQRRLDLQALSDPTPPPVSQWWFGTHPTTLQRIAIARRLEDLGYRAD
jgi:STE24 endopeptidase